MQSESKVKVSENQVHNKTTVQKIEEKGLKVRRPYQNRLSSSANVNKVESVLLEL